MADLGTTFKVDELPKSNGYDLIPAGWYRAMIYDAELRNTKSGTGTYINMRFDITDQTCNGKVVFANINIKNDNAKAEEIARQQLGDIMRAIGLTQLSSTDQLVGRDLMIKVTIKPETDDFPARNEIKGYKAIGSVMSSMPDDKNNASTPPWVKK